MTGRLILDGWGVDARIEAMQLHLSPAFPPPPRTEDFCPSISGKTVMTGKVKITFGPKFYTYTLREPLPERPSRGWARHLRRQKAKRRG